jgi:hypothetical protein
MDSAIKPTFYEGFTSGVNEVDAVEEVSEDTQALAYITRFKGWTLMKEYKEKLEKFLDDSLASAIATGADMKEIGERALVKELAKYVLNEFMAKAENARKSIDK